MKPNPNNVDKGKRHKLGRFGIMIKKQMNGKTIVCSLGYTRILGLVIGCWMVTVVSALGLDNLIPNGVSDVWEIAYGMPNPSQQNDTDLDGQSDYDEARYGTDPYKSESIFALKIICHRERMSLISWNAASSRRYVVQSAVAGSEWVDISEEILGHGSEASFAIPPEATADMTYRVAATFETPMLDYAENYLKLRDTDGDNQNDWMEWVSGSSVVDPDNTFIANITESVSAVSLSWSTQKGISYDLEIWQDSVWEHFSGPFEGTGRVVTYSLPVDPQSKIFRLRMNTPDVDEDGLADWEEHILGLSPLDDHSVGITVHDLTHVQETLLSGGKLTLETVKPTVHDSNVRAVVRVRRSGGYSPIEINVSVSGDWALVSTEPIVLGTGINSVEVELAASAGTAPGYVTLLPDDNYTLGGSTVKSVVLMNENLIDVKDYGAVGDGVKDDTTAIQLAILALEDDSAKNGLYFPSGKYRLAKVTSDFDSPFGWKRILELGYRVDLAGRDLLLRGEPGACLFSDVSPARVNMFIIRAGFRSLTIDGLCFEQDSVPLAAASGEPNFSDAITISAEGLRKVEGVFFKDCEFVNCHRSVSVYGTGYDIRGNGGRFEMVDCNVLNPYGANTEGGTGWGGGQQIYLAAWVGEAYYEGCLFDGGSSDMTDETTSPGGKVKDGCHFGSPLRLVFRNNTVRRMGVEAVHQTNETTLMGVTKEAFIMPFPDNESVVSVWVSDLPSTWNAGESINIRTPGTPGTSAVNNRLTIRGYDEAQGRVLLSNPGILANMPEGSEVISGRLIYLDERSEPTTADYRWNLFDGTLPPGGHAFNEQAGIVSQSRGKVVGNVIIGYANGVLSRSVVHTPNFPAAFGMAVRSNLIVTRHSPSYPEVYTYGINVAGGNEKIQDNMIVCPVSWKTAGIAVKNKNSYVWRNTILADEILVNGLHSSVRATGIGNGYNASGLSAWENHTRGFDLGVGSLGNSAWASFRLRDHTSVMDVIPVQSAKRQPW